MSECRWTKNQNNTIQARDGAILVSAAAGSGKTAVLVERVIQILTDKSNPCDADKLLVVTFTKAAAAEMKERISNKITDMLLLEPENKNLQRQQLMLTRAHISTIHSFCSELIRENFFELDVSPEFRIADDNEMVILKDEAIQKVLEERYNSGNSEFFNLVEAFSSVRDDKNLVDTVLILYDFIRAHPFPEKWLNEKLSLYDENINVKESAFSKVLIDYALEAVDQSILLTENSIAAIENDEKIKAAYGENLSSDIAILQSIKQMLNDGSWNEISSALKSTKLTTLKRLVGYTDDPIKMKVSNNRKEVKNIIKKLTEIFYPTEDECRNDIKDLRGIMKELFSLLSDFETQLDYLKREKKIVDFGDLEHLTLKLLVRPTDDGFERTKTAQNLSKQFAHVMVDEYQDTNEAQDLIFRAISDDESNLFVVGDVKQSIYRFRQAMPEIFLRRKERYQTFDEDKKCYPAKIILDKNFRSRRGILGAVNFVFAQLMSKSVGEMDYTQEERLVPGADYVDRSVPDMSLKILDISEIEEENMNSVEAKYIAKMILEMIGTEYKIKDKDLYRPVTYGDFCILLRAANSNAPEFVKTLEMCGVPAWADTSSSFFGTTEILTIISLLRIIDNPIQDVPLLSILLSPIFDFTPDDIAEIRMQDRSLPLYFALKILAESGNSKCQNFLKELDNYRYLAATLPCDKLIQYIYDRSNYLSVVQAMEEGNLKLNNLRLLLEYARDYEAAGYRGLTEFIRFIDKLEEKKSDMSASNALSEGANVVKIMSIHRSKGLEFPICIVANCSRKFNKDKGNILLHPDLGPGIKLFDKENLRKYTTIQREAIKLDIERSAVSEELRVLYVAMTRAKENLIMITSLKKVDSTISNLAEHITESNVISPYVVRTSNSFSDWILLCALRHPDGKCLRDIVRDSYDIMLNDDTTWNIEIVKPNSELSEEKVDKKIEMEVIDQDFLVKIDSRLNYTYKYSELAKIPAKVTVSELIAVDKSDELNFAAKPAFLSGEIFNPAQKGTALHAFMQFVDLKKAKGNLQEEIDRLIKRGFISKEQWQCLDESAIRRFLKSSLCDRMLNSENIIREFKFTINIDASEVVTDLASEFLALPVILQGAIDCIFEENGELIIIDYKTNRLKSVEELSAHYKKQLDLYKIALLKCMGKNVKQTILYSFFTGEQIFLEN